MALVTVYHGGLAILATEDFVLTTALESAVSTAISTAVSTLASITSISTLHTLSTFSTLPTDFHTSLALVSHNHGLFSGTNISGTYNSSQLLLSVAAPGAAPNAVYGGAYISGSSNGVSTTISVTGLQPEGNYLTTAALSDHSHSTIPTHTHDYQSTGAYLTTAQPVGAYLTTAAVSNHTHSDLYQSTGEYLTTAANSTHNHGAFSGTNITGTYNSSELKLSVAAPGGGGGVNRSFIEIMQGERLTRPFNMSVTQFSNRPIFIPFWLDGEGLAASTVRLIISVVTNTLPPIMTYGAAIYTTNNTSQLGLLCSTTATMNYLSSQSASFSGVRVLDITGMTTPIPDGRAVLAIFFSGAATGSINFSVYGGDGMAPFVGFLSGASGTLATDNTNQFLPWWGRYSANSGSFPDTVNRTQIYGGRSADLLDLYAVLKQI